MAGRPTRPSQTPAQTGRRANISIGGMMGGAGNDITGGPTTTSTPGVPDETGEVNGGDGSSPPAVNTTNDPYKVTHPVLDYLLNGGRGHMAAQAANIGNQQFMFQSGVQQQAALKMQHDQQQFELAKQAIQHDNTLSEASKNAALQQVAAQQQEHLEVAKTAGAMWTPGYDETYQREVNPATIDAARSGIAARDYHNQADAFSTGATVDAMKKNYPSMVDTSGNTLRTAKLASQGALENQPYKNAADQFTAKMQPTMVRTEMNKSAIMPVGDNTTLFNLNTRTPFYMSPMEKAKASMLQGIPGFGSNTGAPPTLPSGLGNGAVQPKPAVTLPPGAVKLPDGRIVNPDGTITELSQ